MTATTRLRGLALEIAEVCPDAWLLNYTNPMAMNVWYLSALGVRNVVGIRRWTR